MTIEMAFVHDGEQYTLQHVYEDDSRAVIDQDGITVITFDSSLNIAGPSGLNAGRLTVGKDDTWTIVHQDGSVDNLGVRSNSYGWRELVAAEVEAAKIIMGLL